jgi:deoxyribodipyrimidine photo-lyase
LDEFIEKKLLYYGEGRSIPQSPELSPSSGLSAYLHFGYISIDEIVIRVLSSVEKQKWAPDLLNVKDKGKKHGYFHSNTSVCDFLDELLTWRDIGYLMFFLNPGFRKDLSILPDWVKKNNLAHEKDKREYLYTKEELRHAQTHDKLWNLAQKEIVTTGKMHNYMRMLWGKKVMEWTKNFQEAFEILEDFNNLYALDGRNPNSYTGILWCFGLFDRPWFPERNIFGTIRYMSTDSAMRKFDMKGYLRYLESLNEESLFKS